MEGNKDESEHCIKLAKKFINSGEKEKAVKYLLKAEKLYPSQTAKDLLELLQKVNGYNMPHQNGATPTESSDTHDKKSEPSPSSSKSTSKDQPSLDYTHEQFSSVQRIKKCKDYYEILGVNKDCDEVELKKQYKRLALQFHPDKNKAPGAAEAFKAIGNAFSVLSDSDKRKKYDMYGSEETQRNHVHHHRHEEYDYSRGFEGDISAEELFNIFFGGGFNSGNVYVRRGGPRFQQYRTTNNDANNRQETTSFSSLMQVMPVLLLVFLPLLSSLFVTDPPYSLVRNHKFQNERKTGNLKITYYVKDNFLQEYQPHLRRIEIEVEDERVQQLRTSCFREENQKRNLLGRAGLFGDRELEMKAKQMRTPSCDYLREILQH